MSWQPISTAPKDGTEILTYRGAMPVRDEELTDIILDLWAKGFSALQISRKIGEVRTRSAVLGMLSRARERNDPRAARRGSTHTSKVSSGITNFGMSAKQVAARAKRKAENATTDITPKEDLKKFEQMEAQSDPRPAKMIRPKNRTEHHCQAIYGHPSSDKDWGYCPHQKINGFSWCLFHVKRYMPGADLSRTKFDFEADKETAIIKEDA